MTIKERIQSEIDNLPEEALEELYELVQQFAARKSGAAEPGLLAKLARVKIEAPPDFASNLDAYMSGEKCLEENLH